MSLRDRITEARNQFSREDKKLASIRNSLRASIEMFDRDFVRASREDDPAQKEDAIYTLYLNLKGAAGELHKLL